MPQLVPLNIRIIGDGSDLREFKLKIVNDPDFDRAAGQFVSADAAPERRALRRRPDARLQGDSTSRPARASRPSTSRTCSREISTTPSRTRPSSDGRRLSPDEQRIPGCRHSPYRPRVKSAEEADSPPWKGFGSTNTNLRPERPIAIKVAYRPFRGETRVEEVPLDDAQPPGGIRVPTHVGDAASMQQVEMGHTGLRGWFRGA